MTRLAETVVLVTLFCGCTDAVHNLSFACLTDADCVAGFHCQGATGSRVCVSDGALTDSGSGGGTAGGGSGGNGGGSGGAAGAGGGGALGGGAGGSGGGGGGPDVDAGNDPSLTDLTIFPGALTTTFMPLVTDYQTTGIPFSTTNLKVKPYLEPATAANKVSISGVLVDAGVYTDVAVSKGLNSIPVAVQAPGGAQRTYNIAARVPRASMGDAGFIKAGMLKLSSWQPAGLDLFGSVVSVSADGGTILVGAPFEDCDHDAVDKPDNNAAAPESGAAYVFNWNGSAWNQSAFIKAYPSRAGDEFASSVALSADGNVAVIGAIGEDGTDAFNPDAGTSRTFSGSNLFESGAVYLYTRDVSGLWSGPLYFKKPTSPRQDDHFGHAVAISGDGLTLAISAPAAPGPSGEGRVYVYARRGTGWVFQKELAPNSLAGVGAFGFSLGISADGSTIAVGDCSESGTGRGVNPTNTMVDAGASASGAVWVFERNGADWSGASQQVAYIKSSNAEGNDLFAWSLALSFDGSALAVGAPGEASSATFVPSGTQGQTDNSMGAAGATYVFRRVSGAWGQDGYLKASNTGAGDLFGRQVAISGDGRFVAAGANGEASAETGVNAVGADNSLAGNGAVYVYKNLGSIWSFSNYVKPNAASSTAVQFAVPALSHGGNILVVGSSRDSTFATESGAVTVFQ